MLSNYVIIMYLCDCVIIPLNLHETGITNNEILYKGLLKYLCFRRLLSYTESVQSLEEDTNDSTE